MKKWMIIIAVMAFALIGAQQAAFAEEGTDEQPVVQPVQPVQLEALELPVGGWAPAEPVYVPEDLVVEGSDATDSEGTVSANGTGKLESSHNTINADPNNVFTKGAATTGYKALGTEQRKLYMLIDELAQSFLKATSDLKATRIDMDGEVSYQYIIGTADYSSLGISDLQEALKAFYAYDYDHPAYYWISNTILFNDNCLYPCTEKPYASVSERQSLNALVSNSVKAYVEIAEQGIDTLDKIAIVHDKIVNDIDYAFQSDGVTPMPDRWAHSVQGVFDPHYKRAVCEGYADAFALIMNYMEIPNYYIVGQANSSGPGGGDGHAWNAVSADNGERYLYMDLTWDDFGDEGYTYVYFGMPMSNFEESHHEYTSDSTVAKNWLYEIPGYYNNYTGGTYYKQGGFYFFKGDGTDVNAFADTIKAKAARAGAWVSVLCPDEESVAAIASALGVDASYYVVQYEDYNYAYLTAPLGITHTHAWSEPAYTWAEDYSSVTADRICEAPNCDILAEMETVKTTSKITKKATYTAMGQRTYTATFANPAFKTQSKTVTNVPKLAKKTNTMKVKSTMRTVKVKALKKKALTVAPLTVTAAKGKVTYKLVSGGALSKKVLKLNTKTGKVTVKKKAKKGTYKIRVKVTAAGTTVYKALSKTVYVTVRVK